MSNKSITTFFLAASLIFSGCTAAQMKTGILVISLISSSLVVVAAVQEVQAAILDVEAKRLEFQATRKNGESIKLSKYLTDRQLEEIIQTGGKLKVKFSNGKEVVIQVACKTSSNLNPKLENIIKYIMVLRHCFAEKLLESHSRRRNYVNTLKMAQIFGNKGFILFRSKNLFLSIFELIFCYYFV